MAFPANNCDPRLIVVDEANGCTLTRASIRAYTRQDFEDQGFKEIGMDKIIASTKEARMAGVRERSLTDLLLSRHVGLSPMQGAGSQSVIAPYSLVPRRNVVNACYFQIESGVADPQAGANGIPAHAWQITVNVGSSQWVSSPSNSLKNLEKYFLPGAYVMVEWKDGSEVAHAAQFKVIKAENADVGSTSKATVTLEPRYTIAGWAALTAGQKAVYQPTAGQVNMLANSVSDYESYGHQIPAYNDLTLLEYWHQTHRWAFSYNDEYVAALQAPLTSDFFKKFRTLPIAMQRKQVEMWNERVLMNTFFYGEEINENQTIESYQSLPRVVDPADPGCPIEFKSNTLGIRRQLDKCGRRSDLQNTALDLDSIFESCYNLKRNRETTSGTISVIDAMTDRFTGSKIRDLLIGKYYKTKFGTDTTAYFQPGQKITYNGMTVLEYNMYDLPDQGVQLAVFVDEYFNDRLAAFSAAQKSRGRSLWFIDWSDVAINVLRMNQVKRVTNTADDLYQFVMTPNVKHTLLNSKKFEVRLGDTNRSLLQENFSDECPSLTVTSCDLAA